MNYHLRKSFQNILSINDVRKIFFTNYKKQVKMKNNTKQPLRPSYLNTNLLMKIKKKKPFILERFNRRIYEFR